VTYDLGDGGDPAVTVSGNLLTLDGDFGVFSIDFETGDYNYMANTDISNFETELFGYTIIDTDGEMSSAVLTIEISPDMAYVGTAGNDDIDGGSGNDYIVGQAGDDTLSGGAGHDRFVFLNAATDGNDVIEDFGNGDDQIDLSHVFEELGIAAGDRGNHVVFNTSGSDTTITVTDASDTEVTGFSVLVENVSLDVTDIGTSIVVDES
jgi:Ca2+-binding RTX toxin-like protein